MSESTNAPGCTEYHEVSRRDFLGSSATFMALSTMPAWLPRVVLAQTASSRDIILSVFLRGGHDGLSMIYPFTDPNYYTGRPTIAIPQPDSSSPNRGIALDGFWGMSQAMSSLYPAYQAGQLLAVQQTGLLNNTRSHFDAMRFLEVGKAADPNLMTGWLGRHLATSTPMRTDAPLRAVGLASGLQRTLVGGPRTLPIPNPASFGLGGDAATRAQRQAWLEADYAPFTDTIGAPALDALNTISLLQSVNFNGYAPINGAVYPNTSFGRGMRATAALIKADLGVEAIQLDIGGWDTHSNQSPLTGSMSRTMADLANSLSAFWLDVISATTDYRVTVVVVSEFGRNVRENGSAGTDHGRGTCMFAMGRAINGGRVLTNNWQPLARENLEIGQDLRVTIDHRDILSEIVTRRLGNPNLGVIFPDYVPTNRGICR
ncbi:MAG: DUF1501 domain-containing protein [Gemmatimonadaceae bacterium]|nr:DUF1501 domain-containing protein [Gemmatimonadaceae bacterium]